MHQYNVHTVNPPFEFFKKAELTACFGAVLSGQRGGELRCIKTLIKSISAHSCGIQRHEVITLMFTGVHCFIRLA